MRSLHLLPTLCLVALAAACEESPRGPATRTVTMNKCGNGRVDPGETCDKARTGTTGVCVESCSDNIACTADRVVGSKEACNATCSNLPISACANADGCCPEGCTGANDDDCSTTCGNNVVDPRETCDNNCPAGCDDQNSCTRDTQFGSASTCSLSCGYQVITACMNGDGCCAGDCSSANDGDCSTTCGNGTRDEKETCDGDCPTSCNDNNTCTVDTMTGSARNCNVDCSYQPITACRGGDNCCAPGCTHMNDSDCSALCGNGMVDEGEKCDGSGCPTSCSPPSDACRPLVLVGSASTCSAECRQMTITACMGGDGCCPSICMPSADSDCAQSPQVGDACSGDPACAGLSIPGASTICYADGFPGGYCTAFCTSAMCPSGSRCDGMTFLCIKECGSGGSGCTRSGYSCQSRLDFQERGYSACVPMPN